LAWRSAPHSFIPAGSSFASFDVVVELVGWKEVLAGEAGKVQDVRERGGVVVVWCEVTRWCAAAAHAGYVTVLEPGGGQLNKLGLPDVAGGVDDKPGWVLLASRAVPAWFEFRSFWRAGACGGWFVGGAVEDEVVGLVSATALPTDRCCRRSWRSAGGFSAEVGADPDMA
jgi:hypothetical protein